MSSHWDWPPDPRRRGGVRGGGGGQGTAADQFVRLDSSSSSSTLDDVERANVNLSGGEFRPDAQIIELGLGRQVRSCC